MVEATQLPHDSIRLLSIRKGSVLADFEVRGAMDVVEKSLSHVYSQVANADSKLNKQLCQAVSANEDCKVAMLQVLKVPASEGADDDTKADVFGCMPALASSLWSVSAPSLSALLSLYSCAGGQRARAHGRTR